MKIFDAANYFIALYRQTIYNCERRKLQKLIIYSDFLYYAENHKRLIKETDATASDKGLSIDSLVGPLYTLTFNLIDERKVIETDFSGENLMQTLNSALHYEIEESIKPYLVYVFKQFGAYSGDDLTEMSKNSSIWKKAREGVPKEGKYYITKEIYDEVLKEYFPSSENQTDFVDIKREEIVSIIKESLSDGK